MEISLTSRSPVAQQKLPVLWISQDMRLAGEVDKHLALHGVCAVAMQEPQLALDRIRESGASLMVLDLSSSNLNGVEFCRTLKSEFALARIPILVLTRRENTHEKLEVLDSGADDFLNLPIESHEISDRILSLLNQAPPPRGNSGASSTLSDVSEDQRLLIGNAVDRMSDAFCILDDNVKVRYFNEAFSRMFQVGLDSIQDMDGPPYAFRDSVIWGEILERCRLRQSWRGEVELESREGRIFLVYCRADAIFENEGDLDGFVLLFTDVSQRKRLEQDLLYLSNHDPLTGLYNRRRFGEILQEAIEEAKLGSGSYLLYLDLDNFKVVNDSVGHMAGDQLLLSITKLLQANTREQDRIGRFGGDEFTILLRDTDYAKAVPLIRQLVKVLDDYRFTYQGTSYATSVSVGVTAIDGTATTDDVLSQADSACFLVKSKGRNGYSVYKPNNSEIQQLSHEANWSMAIKDALRENRFELWLQPIRSIKNRINAYYEVLIRMRDRKGNLILPGAFMPAAERFGNLHQLDLFVVQNAIQLMQLYPQLRLSINLSAKTLNDPNLPGFIERQFRESGVEPSRTVFEITETDMIQNMGHAKDLISRIKRLGSFFALDDFGAGASSLSYLRELPVDILKIDGSFIKAIDKDNINRSLVKAINEVAHILGKQTVAEFVINASVLSVVQELGIDYAQGFHICVPAPPSAFFSRQRGIHDPEVPLNEDPQP